MFAALQDLVVTLNCASVMWHEGETHQRGEPAIFTRAFMLMENDADFIYGFLEPKISVYCQLKSLLYLLDPSKEDLAPGLPTSCRHLA